MPRLTRIGTTLLAGAAVAIPATALACSLAVYNRMPTHPYGAEYPTNGLVSYGGDAEPTLWVDAAAAELELDESLTALLGQPVWRSASEFPAGAALSCWYCRATVGGGPDVVAPRRPSLDVGVTLFSNPNWGAGSECAEVDTLDFDISSPDGLPLDESVPDGRLTALVYVGDNASTAESTGTLASAFSSITAPGDDVDTFTTYEFIGIAGERSGSTPFEQEALCVAVEVMDAAGNISERSEAVCVNTVDRAGPTTTVVRGSGCSISAASGSSSSAWLLLGALTAFVVRRRAVS